jgi:hypothetical protein
MSGVEKPYVSDLLTAIQIEAAIRNLPGILRALIGERAIVHAMYGYWSGLHPDLCYTQMRVGLSWIERFLADSLRQDIVKPGDSDFYIMVPEDRLEIEFCHEGHIHAGGTDRDLVEQLLSFEPYAQLRTIDGAANNDA